jgi:hypothetical protein
MATYLKDAEVFAKEKISKCETINSESMCILIKSEMAKKS